MVLGWANSFRPSGELARGLPSPTILPVRWDDSLPRLPANKAVVPLELSIPHIVSFSHLAFLDITVPSSLVGRINDEFGIRFNGQKAYYGNCLTAEIVRAKSGTVARGDIIDLVNLINYSKEKIGDQLFKNNTGSSCRRQEEEEAAALQVPYSSWRNLGLDEVDFGSGRPARVASCVAEDQPSIPVFVLLPECRGKVGATMLSATVKEEHAEAFH
ncbi:unnamed protein product [Miscanthus lutarioriparius]|uniref:Uncharacterized protein n=1 Tax=Miscanthus lutarioriparius TaxID=422564 RepID=A0A811QHB9_9POAL|nr:unnamed protein product [Miscanthus lutarioriparius]